MKTPRLSLPLRRLYRLAGLLVLTALLALPRGPAAAGPPEQGIRRFIILSLVPDFAGGAVEVYGRIQPAGDERPNLAALGLDGLEAIRVGDEWYVQGRAGSISLAPPADGPHEIRLTRLALQPGDLLSLEIPYANILWDQIVPPPHNLAEAQAAQPYSVSVEFRVTDETPLRSVTIPFTLPALDVDLTLTPLLGKLFANQADSFRVTGQVTFNGLADYNTFENYCGAGSPFIDSRSRHLLYLLDFPPEGFHSLLPSNFRKPSRLVMATRPAGCDYDPQVQSVTATFSGGPVVIAGLTRPAAELMIGEAAEAHGLVSGPGGFSYYEIRLGQVNLGPGDRLSVSVPGATVNIVRPRPDAVRTNPDNTRRIEYIGPARFELVVGYTLQASMLARQAPALVQDGGARLENRLWMLSGLPGAPGIDLLLVGAAAAGMGWLARGRKINWLWYAAALAAGAGLFYLLRGVFGWLALAGLLYAGAAWPYRRAAARGLAGALAALGGSWLDARADRAFSLLARYSPDLNPITPLILGLLALPVLAWLVQRARRPDDQEAWKPGLVWQVWQPWQPKLAAPLALFFFALSTFDAYQKSFSVLGTAALWALVFILRFYRTPREQRRELFGGVPARLRRVGGSRWFWAALAALTLYAGYVGLSSTLSSAAFVNDVTGAVGLLSLPFLQVVSTLLTYLSAAVLFLILYPLLPSGRPVLKAIFLAFVLLSVFLFGFGSDSRLVQLIDQIVIGRFIYYLTAPLLAALVLELSAVQPQTPGAEAQPPQRFSMALENVRKLAGVIGGLASIITPALYARLLDYPVLTGFFQLLELLSQVYG